MPTVSNEKLGGGLGARICKAQEDSCDAGVMCTDKDVSTWNGSSYVVLALLQNHQSSISSVATCGCQDAIGFDA